jgi:thiol:disulfide interchange protein DsbA
MTKLLLGCLALLLIVPAFAAPYIYEEGTHYAELQVPFRTADEASIEVTEYFSYGCPHCAEFDPVIEAWKQTPAEDVTFTRTPAVWNKDYQVYAQTYYTLEALNVLNQLHVVLFQAIHDQRRRLNDPELMARFFSELGIDPQDFAKTYNSFGIRASVQQAQARGRAFRATSVPTILVNGKYRIDGKMAGNNSNMLKIADFLIEKERLARSK